MQKENNSIEQHINTISENAELPEHLKSMLDKASTELKNEDKINFFFTIQ